MSSLFQPSYWFTMAPPEVGGLIGNLIFVLFIGVLVFGIVGRIVADRKGDDRYVREIGNRISTLLVTMGVLGLILFFFSFEQIELFGARFWYVIWVIAVVVWSVRIVRYVKRDIPDMKARSESLRARAKYLPKPKPKKKRRR